MSGYVMEIDDSVSATAERIVLHGATGIGKTTFLANSPMPFVIDLDQGSSRIKISRNKKPVTTWLELIAIVRWFADNDHPFKTLGIDTVGQAERLCHEHVIRTVGGKGGKAVKSISEVAGGFGQGYTIAAEEFRNLLGELERVWRKGIRIVLISHTKLANVKNADASDYQRKTLNCHESVANMLTEQADVVLHAYRDISVVQAGFADEKRARAIGGEARLLRCSETPTCLAKNRLGLPDVIPFSWDEFVALASKSETLLLESLREKARRLDVIRGNGSTKTKDFVEEKIGEKPERHKLVQLLGQLTNKLETAEKSTEQAPAPEAKA